MEKELKRVYVGKSRYGEFYLLPFDLKDQFEDLNEKIKNMLFPDEDEKEVKDFRKKFLKYNKGKNWDLIELYARI